MTVKQKRAIYYSIRDRRRKKFEQFIKENNINLKELGFDNIKYLEVICRKLRAKGYNIKI